MRTTAPDPSAVRAMPDFKARRETQPRLLGGFSTQLAARMDGAAAGDQPPAARKPAAPRGAAARFDPADAVGGEFSAAPSPERAELVHRAKGLLGIPYVWGGDTPQGLDCSAFVSRIWGVSRQTTDTLSKVADNITQDDLKAGDVMNLPTWKDPHGFGHVRMFDRWADAKHSKMWVFEETQDAGAKSIHRMIDYDARYQPMRLKELAE